MIDMDRQKAFAVLGLPDDASREEIEALVVERRRRLRQRIVFASTAEQRQFSERALAELENAHAVATLTPDNDGGGFPQGAKLSLAAGTTLADRYVIRRRIGYGENGAVFAALDLSWGNEVALKIIRPELLLVPGTHDRLLASVQPVTEFAHPGIGKVHGLSKMDGHVVIAMEMLPSKNLRSLVAEAPSRGRDGDRRVGLPSAQVSDIVSGLCEALDYARRRTLHLNVKPDNVIVMDNGSIKLTDFGLDNILQPTLKITSLTAREQRRYRAPELSRRAETGVSGEVNIDERADQFSVAALAHFALFAAAPYPDPSVTTLRQMGVTASMADVLAKALSADPADRFATLNEFAKAFRRASRAGTSRHVFASLMGAVGVAAILIAMTSVAMDRNGIFRTTFAPLVNTIVGSSADADRAEVRKQQTRVVALSQTLNQSQNDMRRRVMELRIAMRAAAQSVEFAVTDEQREAAEINLVDATQSYQRATALQEVANPEIFNSPETLNAINMIGLANDHIAANRLGAARRTLTRAEGVLESKLADFGQAERLAAKYIGSKPEDTPSVSGTVHQTQLRRDWQVALQQRRRFAADMQARMVRVPSGAFQMGDGAGIGNGTERPVRSVLVPAFELSAYEVTVSEYQACVSEGACAVPTGLPLGDQQADAPVSGVSWQDAQNFAGWVSLQSGEDYRLPTEAEWEYAARANGTSAYAWGNEPGVGNANCIHCGSAWENLSAAPVGSFAPNAFGLYDMSGNVWEWTADCWHADYTGAPAIAIARQENALCAERVLRGGSWANDAWLARITYRGRGPAEMRNDLYGIRLARSID